MQQSDVYYQLGHNGRNDARNMLRQKLITNIWLLHLVGFVSLCSHFAHDARSQEPKTCGRFSPFLHIIIILLHLYIYTSLYYILVNLSLYQVVKTVSVKISVSVFENL